MKLLRTRHILASALALGIAVIACTNGVVPDDQQTIGEFATATPGGHISISLLTATITLEGGPNDDAQVIGPVATATAAAATNIAATQTAFAQTPTATVPGIFAEPETCPVAGNATLPSDAPSFTRYAPLIAEYLSGGGAPTLLEVRLREWGALSSIGGLVRADRDFTADGVPEVLVVVFDPQQDDSFPQPGDLFVFGCQDGGYRLLHQAGYNLDRSAPSLLAADDVNADRINDLVYSSFTCDEQKCDTEVFILEWNMAVANFTSLLAQRVIQPNANVVVADLDDDILREVAITKGIINIPDAGPQREITTIYKWDGTLFNIAQVNKPDAEYRIQLIQDGDEALFAGRFDEAVDAYEEAAEVPAEGRPDPYKSWTYPDEAAYLRAYARLRLMLTHVRADNVRAAQRAHDDLIAVYFPPIPTPLPPTCDPALDPACAPSPTPTNTPVPFGPQNGIEFMRMADLFWMDFSVNRRVGQACELVTGYVKANPRTIDVLNSFGFANPEVEAEDICPFTE